MSGIAGLQLDDAQTLYRRSLRDLLPGPSRALKPPGGGSDLLGVTDDDVRDFALQGLLRRLSIVGVKL